MKIYELRTYHFRTSEPLPMIETKWFEYMDYLRFSGIETHGVFRSPSRPNAIIALVSFEDEGCIVNSDASAVALATMAGVDIRHFIRVDDLTLQPLPPSPLQ